MLTAKDKRIIEQIFTYWEDVTLPMLKIFGSDITPAHWIHAGYIKGQRATHTNSLQNHLN